MSLFFAFLAGYSASLLVNHEEKHVKIVSACGMALGYGGIAVSALLGV